MKIVGNKEWLYQVLIEAYGVKQIYSFPSKDAMITGCSLYKQTFPEIKITILKCGFELN